MPHTNTSTTATVYQTVTRGQIKKYGEKETVLVKLTHSGDVAKERPKLHNLVPTSIYRFVETENGSQYFGTANRLPLLTAHVNYGS
jgi:hypothetical protein